MSAVSTFEQIQSLMSYADTESWKRASTEADLRAALEKGIEVFGKILELEAGAHVVGLRDSEEASHAVEEYLAFLPPCYKVWLDASRKLLEIAHDFRDRGSAIEPLEDFELAVEEATAILENAALEREIRPMEELVARVRPENPRPDRYRD